MLVNPLDGLDDPNPLDGLDDPNPLELCPPNPPNKGACWERAPKVGPVTDPNVGVSLAKVDPNTDPFEESPLPKPVPTPRAGAPPNTGVVPKAWPPKVGDPPNEGGAPKPELFAGVFWFC